MKYIEKISLFRPIINVLETQVIENNGKPLCEVCKEPAGKHNYYGGKVCPSCRAFFRRAVQNRYYEIFMCTTKLKNCVVNLQTRKSCQYCRFQKCLNAGMKIAWVLPDGERTKRYNKLLKNGFVKNDNGKLYMYMFIFQRFIISYSKLKFLKFFTQVQFQNLKHKQDFSLNN